MKKENFVSVLLGTIGVLIFGLGMCMCLITAWGAFRQGVGVSAAGAVVLLVMLLVRRKMQGAPAIVLNGKAVGTVLLCVGGALVLGIGMCMTMLWGMMIPGIVVGIAGILLLLSLIPICVGLK